jgi:lipase chaperone LimK
VSAQADAEGVATSCKWYDNRVYRARLVSLQRTSVVGDSMLLRAWQQSVHYLGDLQVRCGVLCLGVTRSSCEEGIVTLL